MCSGSPWDPSRSAARVADSRSCTYIGLEMVRSSLFTPPFPREADAAIPE